MIEGRYVTRLAYRKPKEPGESPLSKIGTNFPP